MENNQEPPIGVAPHWYIYNQRIKDLSASISRYVSYIEKQPLASNERNSELYELLSKWAFDLSEICKLEATLLKKDKGE